MRRFQPITVGRRERTDFQRNDCVIVKVLSGVNGDLKSYCFPLESAVYWPYPNGKARGSTWLLAAAPSRLFSWGGVSDPLASASKSVDSLLATPTPTQTRARCKVLNHAFPISMIEAVLRTHSKIPIIENTLDSAANS